MAGHLTLTQLSRNKVAWNHQKRVAAEEYFGKSVLHPLRLLGECGNMMSDPWLELDINPN